MNVTRDVILDLAPPYLSGDASPDTRALVDEYLTTDAELARWFAEQHSQTFATLVDTPPLPPLDLEVRTLRRTKRRLAGQRWALGLGCYFLALSLSAEYTLRNGRLVEMHLLALDHPAAAALLLGVSAICWLSYATLRRGRRRPSAEES